MWNPFATREPRIDPLRNLGVKIDVPELDGKLNLMCLLTGFFDLRYIPDKYKVKLVAIKLRKYASL